MLCNYDITEHFWQTTLKDCGFKEGVGFAYSKCRHCECSFEDMQINFDEENFEERTIERHVRQCRDIEKASTEYLKNSLKTKYGIK